ncbi:NAD(P)H-hydrate dehydratase [Saccharomonospora saliphila]|uniref:NAD(P)H-hydrate dehydratase n=1 Tax=Saccharomonospora saliphila TaxID=369829 RepID=UPI00037AE08A|nr:NAD(P)H-hydrate dehydratase [Saccharomonospora saliphila]
MRGVWTTAHVRAAEERLLRVTPERALMRRAAYGVSVHAADLLSEHAGRVSGTRVVLVVGAGNNGGDALWAGFFLRRRGVAVAAVLLNPDKAHAEGLAAFRRAGGRVLDAADTDAVSAFLDGADVVVDGVVGISARGSLRPDAAAVFEQVSAPVLAVDLPSGVDPDTGAVDGPAVRATRTVTFGAHKPVHVLAPQWCGDVLLVDIGLDGELGEPDLCVLDVADVATAWPLPGPADNKYSQGVTGVAAGSSTYPGAAVLATAAAVRATAGMVRYAGPAADVVRSHWPEVVATGSIFDAGRVQAWVVGPGIGTGAEGRDVLTHALGQGVPVCADADALTIIAARPEVLDARDPATPLVLTPHDGEFERLTGAAPGADRVGAVREAARRFHAVVLLKGHCTVVADPGGRVLVNRSRGAWLATAGSGDVLSGLLGALLSSGVEPWRAAGLAADVHARAGELAAGGVPTSASGVLAAVPDALRGALRLSP